MRSTQTHLVCHALRIAKAAPACGAPVSADVMPKRSGEDWYEAERLHRAAADGDLVSVVEMLASGAELDVFDLIGYTPLHYAVKNNQYGIAEALIAHGANVNANDEERIGECPLAVAATYGTPEMVSLLLKHGADPAIKGWMALDAIYHASKRKDEDGVAIQALFAARVPSGKGITNRSNRSRAKRAPV